MDLTPRILEGSSQLILAQPHGGTDIPADIRARLNQRGFELSDTDWHISRLYDGLLDDVTVVSTPIHRYVIDANRDPADQSLYPGHNTTSLCPLTTFDGRPIYQPGMEPSEKEIRFRHAQYHQPYHQALKTQIARVKQLNGAAILYDCHSIRSKIPYLFDNRLPDLNIGTNSGHSCSVNIQKTVESICRAASNYSSVTNGRFKGGWTTRHYGDPAVAVQAIQMEISQRCYMQESPPWTFDDNKAAGLRQVLREILVSLRDLVI